MLFLCKANFTKRQVERKMLQLLNLKYAGSGQRYKMKNRIEEIRKERGLKQEELAEVLEVSRQTISSLENGRYNPSIILAFKVAAYFDMQIEEIFIYGREDSQ